MVVDVVRQIEGNVGLTAFLESITVHADPLCCCYFGLNSIPIQIHRVIAGFSCFAAVMERAAKLWSPALVRTQIRPSDRGHHQQIAQITVACAAEAGVGKPQNGGVFVLIACAVFVGVGVVVAIRLQKRLIMGLGGDLHHAIGHRRSGIGVAHSGGPDHGVNPLSEVFNGAFGARCWF